MSDLNQERPPRPDVVSHLLDQLRRHPKRVVFTEGEDERVIAAAARLVEEKVVAPILLGNPEKIRQIAGEAHLPMDFIHVIEPKNASDFDLFCKRVQNMDRYRSRHFSNPAEVVARPHYFGSLMVQYGQADAIIGGNQCIPASYFRALLQTVKPLPHVSKIFGVTLLIGEHLKHIGSSGLMFLADTAMVPKPSVEELSTFAIETGKLAQHALGRAPLIAMLSHSTKGSSGTKSAQKMAAATTLAQSKIQEQHLDFRIEGEVQADVAVDPMAAETKIMAIDQGSADVLIFPNLDAAHISMKLLQHLAGAQNDGQIIVGLSRPAAQVPRTASVQTIFGTAAAVAVEAIK
ncbi:MAG: phosphate acyltransferase, partial [Akkermansiaceae bacterium]|nr:phosphate acyltransferase [Akkermansiaceae bacterium]